MYKKYSVSLRKLFYCVMSAFARNIHRKAKLYIHDRVSKRKKLFTLFFNGIFMETMFHALLDGMCHRINRSPDTYISFCVAQWKANIFSSHSIFCALHTSGEIFSFFRREYHSQYFVCIFHQWNKKKEKTLCKQYFSNSLRDVLFRSYFWLFHFLFIPFI